MLFHYTREHGPEGCILTGEGEAAGVDLASLLSSGKIPLRAALELGAALADILSIAVQDEAVHGDVKPGFVKIDVAGAISIEAWGTHRQTCRAPEAMPIGPQTDVYALGVILHALMSDDPLGALPKDPDDHDDEVVDKILAMDFGEMSGKRWVQDIRQFVALCMAFDPSERPEALDVANVLAHVSDQCPEPGLHGWAARQVPRVSGDAAPSRASPEPQPEEQLDGPTTSHGPLQTGMFKAQTRTAPAAKGEATAFWTKDKIEAMLAEEDADDDDYPAPTPAKPAQSRPAPLPSRPSPAPAKPAPRPAKPAPQQSRPAPQPAKPTPRPARPAPQQATPAAAPVVQGPVAAGPTAGSAPTPQPAPKKGGIGKFLLIGVVLIVLLGIAAAAVAGITFFVLFDDGSVDGPEAGNVQQPEPATQPATEDTDEPAKEQPAQQPATKTTNRKTSGTGSSSTGSSSTGSTTPATTTTTVSTTPAAPVANEDATGGEYAVRFVAQGQDAELECFDGRDKVKFVNATNQTFTGVVTCRVHIDGAMGVVQVRKAETVACIVAAGKVSCGAS